MKIPVTHRKASTAWVPLVLPTGDSEGIALKSAGPLFIPLPSSEEMQFKDMAREIVRLAKSGHHAAAYAELPGFLSLCSERWEHENKKAHVLSGTAYDALRQDHPEWAQKYLNASTDRLERAKLLPTVVDERQSVQALLTHVSRGGSLETCPRPGTLTKIAFVCPDNAVLSPMAETFAAHEGGEFLYVISGGVNPAQDMSPLAVKVLSEIGLELQDRRPKSIPHGVLERYDLVVGINSSRQEVLPDSKRGRFKAWPIKLRSRGDLQQLRLARDAVHRQVGGLVADFRTRLA